MRKRFFFLNLYKQEKKQVNSVPANNSSECFDISVDHFLFTELWGLRKLHNNQPMLVIAPVEHYCLFRRPVAPIRRRIVEGRVARTGCFETGRVANWVRAELRLLFVENRYSEAGARRSKGAGYDWCYCAPRGKVRHVFAEFGLRLESVWVRRSRLSTN